MAFDGEFGTGLAAAGVRGPPGEREPATEDFALAFCAWDTTLATPSGFAVGRGGGNGEMEIDVTDAVCAW
jgi:hypothetical protein